jgi:hypothetical protein
MFIVSKTWLDARSPALSPPESGFGVGIIPKGFSAAS